MVEVGAIVGTAVLDLERQEIWITKRLLCGRKFSERLRAVPKGEAGRPLAFCEYYVRDGMIRIEPFSARTPNWWQPVMLSASPFLPESQLKLANRGAMESLRTERNSSEAERSLSGVRPESLRAGLSQAAS